MDKTELGLFMAKTFKAIGGRIEKRLRASGIDLPMEQFIVLDTLNQHDNLIQQELSEILNKDKSGILRIVDGLEERSYVMRVADESDRRKKHIAVTEEGSKIYQEVLKLEGNIISEVLNGLSDKDLSTLEGYLQVIQKNLV